MVIGSCPPPDLGVRLFDVFLFFAMYFFVCCVVRAPLILSPISHSQSSFVHVHVHIHVTIIDYILFCLASSYSLILSSYAPLVMS